MGQLCHLQSSVCDNNLILLTNLYDLNDIERLPFLKYVYVISVAIEYKYWVNSTYAAYMVTTTSDNNSYH